MQSYVELQLQECNFTPTGSGRELGRHALRAKTIVGMHTNARALQHREYDGQPYTRRSIALPPLALDRLFAFYQDIHAALANDAIVDCHSTAQYLAGYAPSYSQIDLSTYRTSAASPVQTQPGQLYSMRNNEGYVHSVLGTSEPQYTLSTMGPNGYLIFARTEHLLRSYTCSELVQLQPVGSE